MKASNLSVVQLKKTTVAVLGFGRSGRSVTDLLLSLGVLPNVYVQHPVSEEVMGSYARRGVRFFLGFPEVFAEGVLMRSPGIRPDIAPIRQALARGARLSGEVDLFLANTKARVIGVTGSDGKTTTATLIAALLRAAGKRVVLGGNNGSPLLPHLDALGVGDYAVVELSSFQLMTAPAPDVAVLTNLTPNHLNWHTDFLEYAASKCRITQGAERLVTLADDPLCAEIAARATMPVTLFSAKGELPLPQRSEDGCVFVKDGALVLRGAWGERTMDVLGDFSLPGVHNLQNLAAAAGAVCDIVNEQSVRHALRSFSGVAHRLQTVGTVRGVRYIDSSIDTSPTRVAAALAALGERPLVIAGGRGKGIDLAPLADTLSTGARAVFLYGETAAEIATLLGERVPHVVFELFADAFFAAADAAVPGESVLLSPGCTAFDQFRDFEHRAEVFCHLVKDLERKNSGTLQADTRHGGLDERHGL